MPKVPLTDDWLVYKNYQDFSLDPAKDTFRNCLCTPYMYCKYNCIFGLTGSVGGDAEPRIAEVLAAATGGDLIAAAELCDEDYLAELFE